MRDVLSEFMNAMFNNLDQHGIEDLLDSLATIIRSIHVATYPADTVLCHEGAEEDTFYIIARGEVAVYKQLSEGSPKDLLARKAAGEFFGEMALVLNAPRSADVVTTVETTVLELDRKRFERATKISPRLAELMSTQTTKQLTSNWEKAQEKQGGKRGVYQIFTSYSRVDESFVGKLVTDLQHELSEHNITIWMDTSHIRLGERWDTAIEKALEESHAMLLVLSAGSLESVNVRDEWSQYLQEGKPIIPLMKEDCKAPTRIHRLQYVPFFKLEYTTAKARIQHTILELAQHATQR